MPTRRNMERGLAAEQKVRRQLAGVGAKTTVHSASRGPGATDVEATWPTGTRWMIQVKSSSIGSAPWPTARELGRLKARATKARATAVVAQADADGTITYRSARNGTRLYPPDSRRRA